MVKSSGIRTSKQVHRSLILNRQCKHFLTVKSLQREDRLGVGCQTGLSIPNVADCSMHAFGTFVHTSRLLYISYSTEAARDYYGRALPYC
jgi:hypothetical protein